MRTSALCIALSACILLASEMSGMPGLDGGITSSIQSVKLYQNQAKITRQARLTLKKGENVVVLVGLPPALLDWSVRSKLPKNYKGKILSVEVEKKALLKKRQKRIVLIEKKLENLREKDLELLDDLKSIKAQQKFLDSILSFTNQTASRELATRMPQIKVWNDTLNYVTAKKKKLLSNTRLIEKQREEIGKRIQKWEFELSEIAGDTYFRNYQTMNKAVLDNRSSMNVQQFANTNEKYAERKRLLRKATGKVEIEKRLIIHIFSGKTREVDFAFSYIIPQTYWQMQYDIRARKEKKSINMIVYANIYQKTGEDWTNVKLSLSTGSPVRSIKPPALQPWFLDIYSTGKSRYASSLNSKMKKERKKYDPGKASGLAELKMSEEEEPIPASTVEKKGPYLEIGLPLKQSINSSNKYQKKYITEYALTGENTVEYFYELIPAMVRNSFLKVRISNETSLPWLTGEAQIFLENEFLGKTNIPFTPKGKREELALTMEGRITGVKELVKKYEDTSGLFGGNRRILYSYKITVENQLSKSTTVMIQDIIPVSRNKKITVELKKLSHPFLKDGKIEKSTEFARGLRTWKLKINSHKKVEILYEIIITVDKDITVQGLR